VKHADLDLDVDSIVIESPCPVPWDSMTGDDVRRFCGQCRLHVYDLSRMTRPEIQRLHRRTGGQFCKRIWRRPDGRVITSDCGPLRRAVRRRLRAIGAAAAGLLAFLGLVGCGSEAPSPRSDGEPGKKAAPPAGEQPKAPEPDATETIGR
jgi:hypothetical protein